MQTLRWYHSRLKAMSGGEICWRLASAGRNALDRAARVGPSVMPGFPATATPGHEEVTYLAHLVNPLAEGREAAGQVLADTANTDQLMHRADQLCEGRLTLFDRYACDVGPGVQWNFDHSSARPTPTRYAATIDYRDFSRVGDAKVVWELSRHHHLVVLARAYQLSKDPRYARKVIEQLSSWIQQCPPGMGMNWRSPLELAIRLINWVWSLGFVSASGLPGGETKGAITQAAYRQLRDITRKYSRYSSANNHLVGEAAGVFIASCFFSGLRDTERWKTESREILCQEIEAQTHADGGHREKAIGYHLFVLEFFLLAGLVGRRAGMEFPAKYWKRLERMFEFVAAFMEGGAHLPMFGDCDDGYVLDLGEPENRARELLAVGAVLFGRGDFRDQAGRASEGAFWLLGPDARERIERLPSRGGVGGLRSKAFAESGYYLLQRGGDGCAQVSVTFDCGELGFGAIAAHGHADALSFTMRAFGEDVFVDPGTYDYFTDLAWRDYFRGTRAHNTVVVDGRNQSEMLGPFLWGRQAGARCLSWENDGRRTAVSGEHDGYTPAPSRVMHRRSISLDHSTGETVIQDDLHGAGRHTAELCFHLAEQCAVKSLDDHRFEIDCGPGGLILELDPELCVSVYRGCSKNRLGWISRGYHRIQPATALIGSCVWQGSLRLTSRIAIGERSGGIP